ncbi:uncharacterized protein LOC127811341 isoform X2 [Diospyros lotus]|uniref:uncharacterized protein LOC127811341 isoform X2 n=1 Tax=Diospyros lotus TaxID=55363 RepID=UPI0022561167|nr:uncharacterized protein LOC127811341 isoform X2 [Diospyros lotus]
MRVVGSGQLDPRLALCNAGRSSLRFPLSLSLPYPESSVGDEALLRLSFLRRPVTGHSINLLRMSSLIASTITTPATIPSVRLESRHWRQTKVSYSSPSGLGPLGFQLLPLDKRRHITDAIQVRSTSTICAAALNATCAAEQTQTVTRQSSTITVAPVQGKEKSPELDDGGSGFPPRDDDDGGGGGGGGGGGWTGGFFFFGFLAFLGFLKDQESEGPYRDSRRRNY